MSLALEKNLWDWASQIKLDHGEDFARVCASLFSDVIDGKLGTTPPLAEECRQFLRDIDAIGKIRAGKRLWVKDDPQYPGYWLVRLIVSPVEIDRWLSERSAAPSPAAAGESDPARRKYDERVAEHQRLHGGAPPLETTKSGVQGDREWAVQNGVSRPVVEKWHRELPGARGRGAPKKRQGIRVLS
jgi:hypothetical protein